MQTVLKCCACYFAQVLTPVFLLERKFAAHMHQTTHLPYNAKPGFGLPFLAHLNFRSNSSRCLPSGILSLLC